MILIGSSAWPSFPFSVGRPRLPALLARPKVYAVQVGRRPGLYRTWDECREQTSGYPGAKFKSFKCEKVAQEFLAAAAAAAAAAVPRPPAAPLESLRASELQELSEEQRNVVRAVLEGRNVFLTGPPGSGKSFVLQRIIQLLKMRSEEAEAVAVCASTGVAAVHVNGCTLHSFLGCGLGRAADFERVKFHKSKTKVRRRLRKTEVLILDEVSMLSGDFLDSASRLLSFIRQPGAVEGRAFGGLQVVLCGDFLQLPPVQAETLAFQAEVWQELNLKKFNLQKNFRQAEDADFKDFLRQLRLGKLETLERLRDSMMEEDGSRFPKIVSTNREVEVVNRERLANLPGEELVFEAQDEMNSPAPAVKAALDNLMVPKELRLKVGCIVMLLVNLRPPDRCKPLAVPGRPGEPRISRPTPEATEGNPKFLEVQGYEGLQIPLVNGSVGQVVGFEDGFPVVRFARGYCRLIRPHLFEGEVGHFGKYSRQQLPLKMAWAMTIHKTQGLTLESGELDLSKVFDPAQLYVALSRFRSLESVKISGVPKRLPTANKNTLLAMDFHRQLEVE